MAIAFYNHHLDNHVNLHNEQGQAIAMTFSHHKLSFAITDQRYFHTQLYFYLEEMNSSNLRKVANLLNRYTSVLIVFLYPLPHLAVFLVFLDLLV